MTFNEAIQAVLAVCNSQNAEWIITNEKSVLEKMKTLEISDKVNAMVDNFLTNDFTLTHSGYVFNAFECYDWLNIYHTKHAIIAFTKSWLKAVEICINEKEEETKKTSKKRPQHIMRSVEDKEARDLLEKMINDQNIDRIFDDWAMVSDTDRALKTILSNKRITIYYDNCYTDRLNVEVGYTDKCCTVFLKRRHDLFPL